MAIMSDDSSVNLIVAVVAGLFALLGSFAGAFLGRRTEYEKWLRQNRSEVFAKFFNIQAEAREKATNALFDTSEEQLKRDIRVTEAYLPMSDYARVVRIYLPERLREEFMSLVREYSALHSQRSLGDSRLMRMEEKLNRIQEIFETTI